MIQNYKINPSRALLTTLRKGDYAHAGDREAIEIVLKKALSFDPTLKSKAALDVGCGFGGTAQDLYEAGFTHVHGIDLNQEAISYAKNKYPSLHFTVADALHVDKIYPPSHFSFICLFNVMYAIENTALLLKKLSTVSQPKGILALFDYTCEKGSASPVLTDLADKPMYPLDLETLQDDLKQAGWDMLNVTDMTLEYIGWYSELLEKLSTQTSLLTKEFSPQDVSKVGKTFTMLLNHLEQGLWGGATIYARKQHDSTI